MKRKLDWTLIIVCAVTVCASALPIQDAEAALLSRYRGESTLRAQACVGEAGAPGGLVCDDVAPIDRAATGTKFNEKLPSAISRPGPPASSASTVAEQKTTLKVKKGVIKQIVTTGSVTSAPTRGRVISSTSSDLELGLEEPQTVQVTGTISVTAPTREIGGGCTSASFEIQGFVNERLAHNVAGNNLCSLPQPTEGGNGSLPIDERLFLPAGLYTAKLAASIRVFGGDFEGRFTEPVAANWNLTFTFGPTPPPEDVCNRLIVKKTKLKENLRCTTTAFIIGAPNLTLDLGKHYVIGDGDLIDIGVLNPGFTNVTIKNGAIGNFGDGIVLEPGTTRNTLEKLTVGGNSTRGIYLDQANDNTIRNNPGLNKNVGDGIVLQESAGNEITKNLLKGNGRSAIKLIDSSATTAFPFGNLVEQNRAESSQRAAIHLERSSENRIVGNSVKYSGQDAFLVSDSSDENQIVDNFSVNSGLSGYVVTGSTDNVLTGNESALDRSYGFSIHTQSGRTVLTDNEASFAGFDGFRIAQSDAVKLAGNVATDSFSGFEVVDAAGTVLTGNTGSFNLTKGFFVDSLSTATTLNSNVAHRNAEQGILVQDATATGSANQATENGLLVLGCDPVSLCA